MRQYDIELEGQQMRWRDIEQVARYSARIHLAPTITQRVADARNAVETMASSGTPYYGINTGLGALCHVVLPPEQLAALSWHTLMSHSCGVGEPLREDQVRAIMFCAAINFSQGCSGLSPWIVNALVHFLNHDVTPIVPSQGSVGYLSHMAHIGLTLIGEGEVLYQGRCYPSRDIFGLIDYEPGQLGAKDGLSLVNGTPAMTGLACLNLADAHRLGLWADTIGAMSFEALSGQLDALDPVVLERKAQPNVQKVGRRVRQLLADSPYLIRQKGEHLQDALSLRSIPQVHGACWEQWEYAEKQIEAELNSASDNPLVLPDGTQYRVVSQANPHGEAVAMACDTLAIAVCEWSSISERRSYRLVTPQANNLPPFLIKDSGVKSGMMIAQYSAASLVAENKRLAQPCVTDNFMTSGLQEDHLSFGEASALKLTTALSNGLTVLAIEYLLASQAFDLLEGEDFGTGTQLAWRLLRQSIPMYDECHSLHLDIKNTTTLLRHNLPEF